MPKHVSLLPCLVTVQGGGGSRPPGEVAKSASLYLQCDLVKSVAEVCGVLLTLYVRSRRAVDDRTFA